jgi:hypothetical protein
MLWFIYLAKLRIVLLDNRSLAILLETYKLLICYTLVFGQPLTKRRQHMDQSTLMKCVGVIGALGVSLKAVRGIAASYVEEGKKIMHPTQTTVYRLDIEEEERGTTDLPSSQLEKPTV